VERRASDLAQADIVVDVDIDQDLLQLLAGCLRGEKDAGRFPTEFERRFRADLYYRVAHHIEGLAPLRDATDRAAIVDALWTRIAQRRSLTGEAQRALAAHPWPGNWRQLVACLRTLVALYDDGAKIGFNVLPSYLQTPKQQTVASSPLAGSIAQLYALEETAILETLAACDVNVARNVARAARPLGVNRSTLYRRLGKPERAH
jgi:sigma-54 dependent transcriptional regulator, acetoin dehydrogenase operon transcriptional activator AcoR